jgi:DNA-binding CsgD family transcriptional regulator
LEEATLAAFDAHLGAGDLAKADDTLAKISPSDSRSSLGVLIGYQTRRARLASLAGDLTSGSLAADDAVANARALGWGEDLAQALTTAGQVALATNDFDQAGELLREAARIAGSAPFAATLANALDGLVIEAARIGDRGRARAIGAAVQGLRASTGCVRITTPHADELRPIIEAVTPANSWFEPDSAKLTQAGQAALQTAASKRLEPRTRPSSGWDSLTKSELAVARLVADGLRNRQIAEQLHISPRTVDSHLAHSFTKLGLTTRTQLAAEALRRAS